MKWTERLGYIWRGTILISFVVLIFAIFGIAKQRDGAVKNQIEAKAAQETLLAEVQAKAEQPDMVGLQVRKFAEALQTKAKQEAEACALKLAAGETTACDGANKMAEDATILAQAAAIVSGLSLPETAPANGP